MRFTELELDTALLEGIKKAGFEDCTAVQEQVLTTVSEGRDLYVQSQTGTGKTAAYLITIARQMLQNPTGLQKKALIMVPTRELAVQVKDEAQLLLSGTALKIESFYGGVGYGKQTSVLKKGVDVIVGTPGRLIDLQESNILDLKNIGFLVVDEADRMFDMGFYPDLRKLIKILPTTKERQTMLFSATLNSYVKNLAWEYTENAHEITIDADSITVDEIDQTLVHVSSDKKMELLLGILAKEKPKTVIIFCNTKRSSEVVAKRLRKNNIRCEFIIGDLPQKKRLQVLDSFKNTDLACLVATDVAARGIDVDDLSMVINFDLPNEAENYVHRIGRTARAGKSGKAYTFCSEQDVYSLPAIERYIDGSIPSIVADESLFIEDKSAGVYIKTDSYNDHYTDRDEGALNGRRSNHNNRFSREKEAGSKNQSFNKYDKKGKKLPSSKLQSLSQSKLQKATTGKIHSKKAVIADQLNTADGVDTSTLSFEERMKYYREKYGENSQINSKKSKTSKKFNNSEKVNSSDKSKNKKSFKNTKKSEHSYHKRVDYKKQSSAKNHNVSKGETLSRTDVRSQSASTGKKQGKSLFARIKGFFKK